MAGASHAKICKTVGPDGSVVYTDRPVASCNATNAEPTPAPAATSPQSQPSGSAKRAIGSNTQAANPSAADGQEPECSGAHGCARAAAGPQPAPSTIDPSIETAVIGVLGLEDMVERTRAFCVKALPTSSRRYDAAADHWKQRNAVTVAKTRRALAQTFVPQRQQLIGDGVKARNEQSLERIASAPQVSQMKWCDRSATEIEARMLDPKENLTTPLGPY